MLKKIVAPLVLFSTLSYAQEFNSEKFQLLAENIDSDNNIITAVGNVVIFSPSYYLSAGKIIYNKEKETFELFDNVLILKDNNIQTQSDYAFINLENDAYDQSPVMLFEKDSNIWVNSKSSSKKNTNIELENSIISSCDCVNPAWSIKVSSASYDTQDKWIHAYNTRLYLKDVPVFYSPYIGFPTDKTRRTGLLPATLGYSNNEGIYYSQPIYYAPKANYDFEFIPQIRSQRGYGSYGYFRLADSPYSMLKLKAGFFYEKDDYVKEFSLDSEKHYGWNIDYERTKLFSNDKTQDGLYASINWLNDVEYQTLENDDDSVSTEKKVESKINYFYNTPEYYGGAYARYYIDTDLESNDSTLQELPQVHLHSYNKEIDFINKLMYSVDTKYINYTRKDGLNADVYELSLPISYTKYFLDDYFYVNIENKSVLSKYKYSNSSKDFDDGMLIQNESSVTVGTDLIKPYKDYLHTINLNAEYSHPSNITKDGDLYKITNDDEDLASFPIAQDSKNINLSLNQSLYGKDSLKQIINHKLSQSIVYDEDDKAKFQNLENFVKYNHNYGYVSAKTIYNIQDKHFIENTANFNYKYEDYSFTLGYYKSKDSENSGKEDLESYNVKASYQLSKDYKVSYYENHNILDDIKNKQGISFNINDRCWNLDLKYEKEIVPSSSTDDDGINQEIVFINLELKPLGGIKQKYKVKGN